LCFIVGPDVSNANLAFYAARDVPQPAVPGFLSVALDFTVLKNMD
jgi:hypothetical protein